MTERANDQERGSDGPADHPVSYPDRNEVLERIAERLENPPVGLVLLEVLVDVDEIGGPIASDLIDAAIVHRIDKETGDGDVVLATGPKRLTIIKSGMTAPAEAEGFAMRIQAGLQAPMLVGEGRVTCQSAIGVAVSRSGDTAEPLVRYAEHALGDARMLGGDMVVAFDDQDRDLLVD